MKESRKEEKIEDDSLKDTMSLHLDGLVKSDPKELSSKEDGDSFNSLSAMDGHDRPLKN
jgi:hypothetical protein